MKIFILVTCLFFSVSTLAVDIKPKEKDSHEEGAEENSFFQPQNFDNKNKMDQEDHSNLLRYKPIYFLYANPTSKFQMSFRLRIIKESHLYFGYTQQSFWDLTKRSAPFRDSTYNPEIFYTYDITKKYFLDNIDFGFFEHNSNGKGDPDSRSFNRSYVRFNFANEREKYIFKAAVKLSGIYSVGETNKDIRDYISPLEFDTSIIRLIPDHFLDRAEINFRFFPGGRYADDWSRGGLELGFVARFGGISFLPALYLQYYEGYAESLLFYNKKVNHVKVGVIF